MRPNRDRGGAALLALLLGIALILWGVSRADAQQSTPDHHWWAVGYHGHASLSTAEWLAREEGLRLEPYHDLAGYPTVCVGHRLSGTRDADLSQWQPKTRAECLDLLDADLERFRAGVDRLIAVDLEGDQETALVSLAYNVGIGALSGSELVRLLNGSAPVYLVVLEWLDWDKAHVDGRLTVVESLLQRRRREVALFYGDEQTMTVSRRP